MTRVWTASALVYFKKYEIYAHATKVSYFLYKIVRKIQILTHIFSFVFQKRKNLLNNVDQGFWRSVKG